MLLLGLTGGPLLATIGVSIGPGETQLTRTPARSQLQGGAPRPADQRRLRRGIGAELVEPRRAAAEAVTTTAAAGDRDSAAVRAW